MSDMRELYPSSPEPVLFPQRVVVVGAGSGQSQFLAGLHPIVGEGLTAVVNNMDDGGGTGGWRQNYPGMSAVGDVGKCALAMSNADAGTRALLDFRFPDNMVDEQDAHPLNVGGQTVRNVILAAANMMADNHPNDALRLADGLLQVQGRVLAASNESRTLKLILPDGRTVVGEHNIEEDKTPSLMHAKLEFNEGDASISEEVEEAIAEADAVVFAPGDLASLWPVFGLRGFKKSVKGAKIVMMLSNLMNRDRHTVGFSTLDYANAYTEAIGAHVIQRTLYNTRPLDPLALKLQAEKGSFPVEPDVEGLRKAGFGPMGFDMLSLKPVVHNPNDKLKNRSDILHDPAKSAAAFIMAYLSNGFTK